MKTSSTMARCPGCGAPRSGGRFCTACGAALENRACGRCGAHLDPQARFCPACGAAASPAAGPAPSRGVPLAPLVVAGVSLLAVVLVLVLRGQPSGATGQPAQPAPAVAPAAGPPDLSQMTPRMAFDRLYNRVMTAAEQGDTGTVAQFSPMALQAYGNLPVVDADARYHAAMLRLHTGDVPGAEALADSIRAGHPSHLFGFVLDAAIARFRRDQAAVQENYRRFLAAYDQEIQAGRMEYEEHQRMLEGFLADARSGGN